MHHVWLRATVGALLLIGACRPTTHVRTSAVSAVAQLQVVEHAGLHKLLEDEHLGGTIAVMRGDELTVACADVAHCKQRVLPASTFKIPNSIIGLETGVIRDADFVIPWDGVTREFADWNRDHSLRSAIKASAVPYYQELARRVGREGMAEWTRKLDYGNAQTGDESQVDQFWLSGPLAISPLEQLDFLRRFARGQLPIAPRTHDIVREIMVLADVDGPVLRGKTGWGYPHEPRQLGWFVGYAERHGQRTYVAVLLTPGADTEQAAFLDARRRLAEQALTLFGAW